MRGIAPLLALACFACSSPSNNASCVAGSTQACTCSNGHSGAQVCASDGTYGNCTCTGDMPDARMLDAYVPIVGVDWRDALASAPFGPRAGFPVVVHNGELWIFGGSGAANPDDVWHSADGTTWTAATANAGWGSTYLPCVVSFNGALWMINPNMNSPGIWSSNDGATWTKQLASLPFGSREAHMCTVWNSQMWLIGGTYGNPAGKAVDVWSSPDGTTWTKTATSYGATVGANGNTTGIGILNNHVFVADDTGVYSSADGVTWTPANLSFTGSNGMVAAGSKLWAIKNTQGVFSSSDGATWTLAAAPMFLLGAGLSPPPGACGPRGGAGFGAFQPTGAASPSLFIIAGQQGCRMASGANYSQYLTDVWTSP